MVLSHSSCSTPHVWKQWLDEVVETTGLNIWEAKKKLKIVVDGKDLSWKSLVNLNDLTGAHGKDSVYNNDQYKTYYV